MKKPAFYVHIVESPSPDDLLDGRTEGNTLCSFLELAEIPCQYNLVVDEDYLQVALSMRVLNAVKRFDLPPIIHIAAHGNENGIQLTNQCASKTILPWDRLRGHLTLLGQLLNPKIGLCMSSCGGAHGKKMAAVMRPEEIPMAWIVGTSMKVNYADAALAFAVFYRGLRRGDSESELIKAMRAASGVGDFNIDYGHVVQQQYSKEQMEGLQRALAQLVARKTQSPGQPTSGTTRE